MKKVIVLILLLVGSTAYSGSAERLVYVNEDAGCGLVLKHDGSTLLSAQIYEDGPNQSGQTTYLE